MWRHGNSAGGLDRGECGAGGERWSDPECVLMEEMKEFVISSLGQKVSEESKTT